MLKVGLTGSIAAGKSFVLECFREHGCMVLDADKVARDVVKPGTAGLEMVVKEFGAGVLTSDGTLDRKKVASIVFKDEARRQKLNSIIHPLVLETQDKWLAKCEAENPRGIAIVDAALMIESGGFKRFDKLIVVWCDPDTQLSRLKQRDDISEAEAASRIAAQMPQEEKKRFADMLIDTSCGFEETRRQVDGCFEYLASL